MINTNLPAAVINSIGELVVIYFIPQKYGLTQYHVRYSFGALKKEKVASGDTTSLT